MANTNKGFFKSETFHMLVGGLAVVALGLGTATAAITIAPSADVNPAMRSLGSGPSMHLNAAYGAGDEDCIWVSSKTTQPNGKVKVTRKMECAN